MWITWGRDNFSININHITNLTSAILKSNFFFGATAKMFNCITWTICHIFNSWKSCSSSRASNPIFVLFFKKYFLQHVVWKSSDRQSWLCEEHGRKCDSFWNHTCSQTKRHVIKRLKSAAASTLVVPESLNHHGRRHYPSRVAAVVWLEFHAVSKRGQLYVGPGWGMSFRFCQFCTLRRDWLQQLLCADKQCLAPQADAVCLEH